MQKLNLTVWTLVFSFLAAPLLLDPVVRAEKKRKASEDQVQDLVWPVPPEDPRIRFVKVYQGESDFKKKSKWRRIFLGPEQEEFLSLKKPYGVAVDKDGRVYVTDTDQAVVFVFDDGAKEVRTIGDKGHVHLATPIGIDVDDSGRVFVGDAGLSEILCFDPDGQLLMAFGSKDGIKNPSGLAVDDARSRILVADSREHKIFVFSSDGNLLQTWGKRGSGEGEFNYPTNIALGPDGRVYVVDTGNFRVQILSPDGEFLAAFGEAGDGFGDFHRPKGIGVDSEGHIYVTDAAFNNFQIFDNDGTLLLFVGTMGKDPGAFWLPAGLHIDATDQVYVADQINARVQVFQYLPIQEDKKVNSSGRSRNESPPRIQSGRR